MRVLILGGGGLLGRHLAPILEDAGHQVTVASRSTDPPVDIGSGQGVATAVAGSDQVVHLASDARKPQKVDVVGTRRVLEAMVDQTITYVSIVGVDRHPFPYYRAKHQVEQMITGSGRQHSIIRATQFHDFVGFLIGQLTKLPVAVAPRGFVFQPVDTGEVAAAVARLVEAGASGRVPDMGGPEILGIDQLARSYMTAVGKERPLLQMPLPGKSASAFRKGVHTNASRAVGTIAWEDYLDTVGQARPN